MTISNSVSNGMNYSTLFSSLNTKSNSNPMSNLMMSINFSELHSIKSGTYKSALDAYYNKTSSSVTMNDGTVSFDKDSDKETNNSTSSSTENTLSKEEAASLAQFKDVQETSADLTASADRLQATGFGSLFEEKNFIVENEDGPNTMTRGYDTDAIYDEVSKFVASYNELVTSATDTSSSTLNKQVSNMADIVSSYASTLSEYGITYNEKDNTLTIDEDTFKSADMESVKETFGSSYSITSRVDNAATYVNDLANYEVNKVGSSGYNSTASYNNTFASGNLYNSFF